MQTAIARWGIGIVAFTAVTLISVLLYRRDSVRPPAHAPTRPAPLAECHVDLDCIALAITPGCHKPVEIKAIPVAQRKALVHSIVADGCQSVEPTTDQVAECEAQHCKLSDGALAWSWATAVAPALGLLAPDRQLTPASAPWYREGEVIKLYARRDWAGEAKAKRCMEIDFKMEQNLLHAEVAHDGGPPPRLGCSDETELTSNVLMLDGRCVDADGSYSTSGGGDVLGAGLLLSRADDTGLVYDSIRVEVTPRCRWHTVDRPGCAEPTCRSCEIALDQSGKLPRGGMGSFPGEIPPVVSHSCEPCPIDHNAAIVPRLAAILRDRTFVEPFDEAHAVRFFRTAADCAAALE